MTDSPLTIIAHVALPQSVIDEAASLRDVLRGGVAVDTVCGYPAVTASSRVAWHTDHHDRYQWSVLLIVRNDHDSIVESRGIVLPESQPVGTLLLLGLRHEHRLMSATRTRDLSWVAINWDWESSRRPTRRDCMADVDEFLRCVKGATC